MGYSLLRACEYPQRERGGSGIQIPPEGERGEWDTASQEHVNTPRGREGGVGYSLIRACEYPQREKRGEWVTAS